MIFARFVLRGIGIVSTMILARILVPHDFGVIALAATVIGLLDVISSIGVDVVLVRDPSASREKYNTAWTLQLMRGVTIGALVVVASEPAASFFDDHRLAAVLRVLALSPVLSGLQNVGIVEFRKNFDFHRDFQFMVSGKVAGFVTTISLAFLWRSYWALVAGMVVTEAAKLAASYKMHPFRPRISLDGWKEIFGYSQWLLLNSILRYVSTRTDAVMIGRLSTSEVVGAYSIAYEISNLALSELVAPIQRALLPGYAQLSGDRDALRQAYLNVLSLALALGLPVAVVSAMFASEVVRVFLGEGWRDAVPFIEVLAICGAVRLGSANASIVYHALGKPRLITLIQAIQVLVAVPLLYLFITRYGPIGAPYAILVAATLQMLINIAIVKAELEISTREFLVLAIRPCGAASIVVGAFVCSPVSGNAAEGRLFDALAILVMGGGATVVAFGSVMTLMWFVLRKPLGAERIIADELRRRFRRPRDV